MIVKYPRLSDQELYKEVSAQTKAGAEELYDRYARALSLAIYRRIREKDSVENLLFQTYLIAWQTVKTYNPRELSLLAWMMNIAKKLVEIHLETNIILNAIQSEQLKTGADQNGII